MPERVRQGLGLRGAGSRLLLVRRHLKARARIGARGMRWSHLGLPAGSFQDEWSIPDAKSPFHQQTTQKTGTVDCTGGARLRRQADGCWPTSRYPFDYAARFLMRWALTDRNRLSLVLGASVPNSGALTCGAGHFPRIPSTGTIPKCAAARSGHADAGSNRATASVRSSSSGASAPNCRTSFSSRSANSGQSRWRLRSTKLRSELRP